MKADIMNKLRESNVEAMFQINLEEQMWVWVNEEIFLDIVLNLVSDDVPEEEILLDLKKIDEKDFIDIIERKLKENNWIFVDQIIFERIEDGFKASKDIKTYVFADRKYYMKKMLNMADSLSWILKAMAIDTYQHLRVSSIGLQAIYDEHFYDNTMLIEEILLKGSAEFEQGLWKVDPNHGMLAFYKEGKNRRQWTEGSVNFTYGELNK
ncbi:hypothetical protein Amet_3181 [Alkaliphilus metalliredigens QYMF]|uniref:Uncharacterized protein n=1 Tax=Alkaliphilus metalliredigens (strain QYMF) TaxID=293826 RepID=A6TT01_ALKMQ|nr:hypothetical protein [Alkaliphilus metalliredigens]ABR49319.1 hypothetical protein Amet_3181 [Alkaliphilus metalliredigens QYMF]